MKDCKICGYINHPKCRCVPKTAKASKSAELPCSATDFDEDEYLEKLWACYKKGVHYEGLSAKDLFISLVSNLIKQMKGEK